MCLCVCLLRLLSVLIVLLMASAYALEINTTNRLNCGLMADRHAGSRHTSGLYGCQVSLAISRGSYPLQQYYTGTPRRLVDVVATSRLIDFYVQLVLADSDPASLQPE